MTLASTTAAQKFGSIAAVTNDSTVEYCYAKETATVSPASFMAMGYQTGTTYTKCYITAEDRKTNDVDDLDKINYPTVGNPLTVDDVITGINTSAGVDYFKKKDGEVSFDGAAVSVTGRQSTLTVKMANKNAVSTAAGSLYYSYTGNKEYSSEATDLSLRIVKDYDGVWLKAERADADYQFAGWFTNAAGTGTALSTNKVYHYTGDTSQTIYAVFTGGPYEAKLVAVDYSTHAAGGGTVNYLKKVDGVETPQVTPETGTATVTAKRNTSVNITATPESGKAFLGWYKSADPTNVTDLDIVNDEFLSDKIADGCKYELTLTEDMVVKAVFADSVTLDLGFHEESTADMGTIRVKEGLAVADGAVATLEAESKQGYEFEGWYTKNGDVYTLISNDNPRAIVASQYDDADGADDGTIHIYAKFIPANAAEIVKNGRTITITINDEGKLLNKVIYQYSGTQPYAYSTWYRFAINGKGFSATDVRKPDYTANANAYDWNGTAGYWATTKDIDGKQITVKHPGYYTFLMYPEGGVMYTRTVLIEEGDFGGGTFGEPTVDRTGMNLTINAHGNEIKAAFYQLTSTDTTLDSIQPAASWYRYTQNGIATEELQRFNGDQGYILIGANSDGRVIPIRKYGWYTFWIKYGNNEIVQRTVKITGGDDEDDSDEVGNGVIKVLANTVWGSDPEVVMKVMADPQPGANKYGVKMNSEVFPMTGNFVGGYYYLDITSGLTAGTTYTAKPVYSTDNGSTWTEFGNARTINTIATRPSYNAYGGTYYQGATGVAYRRSDSTRPTYKLDLDARGIVGSGASKQTVQTTYDNSGWCPELEGTNSSNVTINQTATILTGNSGTEYVQLRYVLRNNGSTDASNLKFGLWTDVQIGNNDSAPVYNTPFGIMMSDDNSYNATYGLSFALIASNGQEPDGLDGKSTTCTAKWFGYWSSARSNWKSNTTASSLTGTDSGAAVSWQGFSIPAGDAYVINCIMGVAPTSALTAAVPSDPGVNKETNKGIIITSGKTEAVNTITNVYYQYSSDQVNLNDCPYTFGSTTGDNPEITMGTVTDLNPSSGAAHDTVTDINLDNFKANGLRYKTINGVNGYRTLGRIYDQDDLDENGLVRHAKNNEVIFRDPGWYTVHLHYLDYAGQSQLVTRYVRITQDDVTLGGPQVIKNNNQITVKTARANSITGVMYQLTSYNGTYFDETVGTGTVFADNTPTDTLSEDAKQFKGNYGYGTGYNYTQTGEDEFRKKKSTSDFTLYTRMGLFEDKAACNAYDPVNNGTDDDTRDPLRLRVNGSSGYRSSHLKNDGSALITTTTPGWYTLRITYGDNLTVTRYVQMTDADFASNAPTTSIDGDGVVTLNANGHEVKNAYINYATDQYLTETMYPAKDPDLTYYLTSANAYSWFGYYNYGQTHFTDVNPADGYHAIQIGSAEDAVGQIAVTKAGWYNVYIQYMDDGVKKTVVQHIKLDTDKVGPSVAQFVGTETTETGGAEDKRMMITYQDGYLGNLYTISEYMYGYVGATLPTTESYWPINSWYRLSLATDGNVTVVKNANITSDGVTGRSFDMVIDKAGYWCVYVKDPYFGNRYYMVQIDEDGVPVRTETDSHAPRLFVEDSKITAIKDTGTIKFIKDISPEKPGTDPELTPEQKNAVAYTKGNVLKERVGNTRKIRTIDEKGRVVDSLATLDYIELDRKPLKELLDKANDYITQYTRCDDEPDYEARYHAGKYAKPDVYDALQAAITANDPVDTDNLNPQDAYGYANLILVQLDAAIDEMNTLLNNFEANSKVIEPDIVTVDGNKISVQVPAGSTINYVIYSAADQYTIATGEREIKETVWDSWTGIASEMYSRADRPRDNTLVLENVPNGVYTFQVKVDGKVYYRNPVVAVSSTEKAEVNDYLGGTTGTGGLIGEGRTLLSSIVKYSDEESGNNTLHKPFVLDILYKLLQDTLTAADAAWADDAMDLETRIQKTADLHNAIRRCKAGMMTSIQQHYIDFTVTNAANGEVTATNSSNNVSTMFISKGNYTTWAEFSGHGYRKIDMNTTGNPWNAVFNVQGDGDYTAYVKYADGVYEFKHFTLTGYTGYVLTATGDGANIEVSITPGAEISTGVALQKEHIEQLAIAYGIWSTYSNTDTENWTALTLDGDPAKAVTPIMGMGEHTIHAKIDGVEYFIPAFPAGIPVVHVAQHNSEGGLLAAYTKPENVAWVAYAKNDDSADPAMTWTDMLTQSGGVHYIAQNEKVTIPEWTNANASDKYTFYFKGANACPDYIVVVTGTDCKVATEELVSSYVPSN